MVLGPHLHVAEKYQQRYLRSEGSQPQPQPPPQGFQCQEDKSPSLLAAKISGN